MLKKHTFFFFLFLAVLLPVLSFAQEQDIPLHQRLFGLYKLLVLVGFAAVIGGLLIAGVQFLTSFGQPEKIKEAREGIIKSLLGLVIIILIPSILGFITPGLSLQNIFRDPGELDEKAPPAKRLPTTPGVYVKTVEGRVFFLAASMPVLDKDMDNKIKEARIVNNPEANIYYEAVFFSDVDYKGYCFFVPWQTSSYIEVTRPGKEEREPFASSVLVYRKEMGTTCPEQGCLVFYREPFYSGESFGIWQNETGWTYLKELEYSPETPLDKDNISSIKIFPKLSVLMVSHKKAEDLKKGEERGPYCQLFYDKGGKYSVASIKNEYIRADKKYLYLFRLLAGSPR